MSHDKLDLKKLEQRIEVLENQVDNRLSKYVFFFKHKGSPEHIAFLEQHKNEDRKRKFLIITGPTVEESAQWHVDYDQRQREAKK